MKKILNLVIKVALWCFAAIFALLAFGLFPSLASLFALLLAAIIAPVSRLQGVVKRFLKTRKIKAIALVALFILTVVFTPSGDSEKQSEAEVQAAVTEEPVTELLKELPTFSPESTPEPTVEPTPEPIESTFEIHFLDVGQADSILVLCDNQAMLVDGGDPDDSSFIYSYLKENEIEHLDVIVCTHAHSDHAGGLAGALNSATVGTAYAPVVESENSAFVSFVEYLSRQNVSITVPDVGESFKLGSSVVTVLGPIEISEEPNNTSLVLRIEYGETSFLLAGDAEIAEEEDILNGGYEVESTVLKVGHHGSSTSSSPFFISAVSPEYAIVSDGMDDSGFGHLTERTIEKLQTIGAEIYRTDLHGTIICTSDGKTVSISTEKEDKQIIPFVIETLTETVEDATVDRVMDIPLITPEPSPEPTVVPTPEPQPEYPTYIFNTNSRKFHYPYCSSVDDMKESNKKEFFGTREEARNMGYDPCGRCHP